MKTAQLVVNRSFINTVNLANSFLAVISQNVAIQEASLNTPVKFVPTCGFKLVEKYSRAGKKFIGCSNYPNCTYIQPRKGFKPAQQNDR